MEIMTIMFVLEVPNQTTQSLEQVQLKFTTLVQGNAV